VDKGLEGDSHDLFQRNSLAFNNCRGKDLRGNGHGMFEGTLLTFTERTEEIIKTSFSTMARTHTWHL
jgi:hypothetical protein